MTIKLKIRDYCDRIMEFSLYSLVLFIPFSKAMIEISATLAIVAWIIKRATGCALAQAGAGKPYPDGHRQVTSYGRLFPSTYLNLPLFIFILIAIISIITSTYFALSIRFFVGKTLEWLFLYFVTIEVFAAHSSSIGKNDCSCRFIGKKKIKNFLILILISASVVALDAGIQYFTGKDLIRGYIREAGWITASFQMPNDFAGYLIFVIPVGVTLFFFGLKNKKIKLWMGITITLLIIFLIMSGSKGAWIGFMSALIFMSMLKNKKIFMLTLVMILVMSFFFIIFIKIPLKTLLTFSDAGGLDRRMMWQAALKMIENKPVYGQGLGTFMSNFTKYAPDYPYLKAGIIPYAHNGYLQLAAETGVFGLAAFLWLIITPFVKSIKFLKKIKDKFYHNLLLGLLGGMLAFLIHSGVDTNLQSLQLSALLWFMLGFIVSAGKICETA